MKKIFLSFALFFVEPQDLVNIFHNGSLMHDLQRVGGVNWSWNVGLVGDQLQIKFYKNKPFREKTPDELQAEDDLNNQIAEYLNQR